MIGRFDDMKQGDLDGVQSRRRRSQAEALPVQESEHP